MTHGCVPLHNQHLYQVCTVDDTTVVGQISNNNELAYREEIQSLSTWCSTNNFTLSATKMKGLVVVLQKSNMLIYLSQRDRDREVSAAIKHSVRCLSLTSI